MIDNSKRPGSTSTSTATSNPYPEYVPIERGPIFGFSTWEAYEADIKSSHLIYQSIIEGIYPTVGEQIEMKNNLINHAFMWIIVIFSVIIFLWFLILNTLFITFMNKFLYDAHICKSFWIIISMVILIQISIPSLLLLYVIDELDDFNLTIKAIGHQWYWKYEYRDFWSIENF